MKERLEKVKRQRGTQRKARERRGTFRVSLVGYTNAGKSTLFNSPWSRRAAYAADQLFATLDTTTRALWLGEAQASVSLSDTVGFIRDLPHKLVEAFEATLQEAADADLLLHVVDAASPHCWSSRPRSSACWRRSAPRACRRCWSTTSATCSKTRCQPRAGASDWILKPIRACAGPGSHGRGSGHRECCAGAA